MSIVIISRLRVDSHFKFGNEKDGLLATIHVAFFNGIVDITSVEETLQLTPFKSKDGNNSNDTTNKSNLTALLLNNDPNNDKLYSNGAITALLSARNLRNDHINASRNLK